MTPARTRSSERGFTIVELLVVCLIIAILVLAATMGMRGAKVSSRAKAMQSVGARVAQSVSTFNRMRPPIATDPLTAGTSWTSGQAEGPTNLYAATGERLLVPWPHDPYSGRPITITRRATCPATVGVGQVVVCRPGGGASRSAFRVMAGARSSSGAAYVVYDQSYG